MKKRKKYISWIGISVAVLFFTVFGYSIYCSCSVSDTLLYMNNNYYISMNQVIAVEQKMLKHPLTYPIKIRRKLKPFEKERLEHNNKLTKQVESIK